MSLAIAFCDIFNRIHANFVIIVQIVKSSVLLLYLLFKNSDVTCLVFFDSK